MTILKVAELVGYLVSVCPAIPYSPLYIRQLEIEKISALRNSEGFSSQMTLSDLAKSDLSWWITSVADSCMRIRRDRYDQIIFTDASLTGLGATSSSNKTRGFWSTEQKKLHINQLELLAILYGL